VNWSLLFDKIWYANWKKHSSYRWPKSCEYYKTEEEDVKVHDCDELVKGLRRSIWEEDTQCHPNPSANMFNKILSVWIHVGRNKYGVGERIFFPFRSAVEGGSRTYSHPKGVCVCVLFYKYILSNIQRVTDFPNATPAPWLKLNLERPATPRGGNIYRRNVIDT
jgi:hypothetical protein